MDKNAIKKYAVWARNELIARVSQKAQQYGITAEGYGDKNADSVNGVLLSATEKKQRQALIAKIDAEGFEQVMEEVAYTWFNRFTALRFMEVNNYLPSHTRVFTNEANEFKPQILADAISLELEGLDMDKVYALKDANKDEELYKYLLIVQCNALSSILPGMFQKIADYTELLLPDYLLRSGSVIDRMIAEIKQEYFNVTDENGQLEIIGWLYQYYNDEKKSAVIDMAAKTAVKKEDIPAATQLFTTDWIVKYIVDNTVGQVWMDSHPESSLYKDLPFYFSENKSKYENDNKISPVDLTFFDPCIGSGHFAIYAFEVLLKIYIEYGYSEREAASEIVKNNIFGLDIDDRAAQLAYFSVMMKARQYDRRFFSRGIAPHIMAIKESNDIDQYTIDYFCGDNETLKREIKAIVHELHDAKEYGSIISVKSHDFDAIHKRFEEIEQESSIFKTNAIECLLPVIKVAEILSKQYVVVDTNPPYLNKYNDKLKGFLNDEFKEYSGDLFSVFIYRNFGFCKKDGYVGFMTPYVWMFIKTYEPLRNYILSGKNITSLIQYEYSAFEEATVPICSFTIQNRNSEKKGVYIKLSDFKGGMSVQERKTKEALASRDCNYKYETAKSDFEMIPGSPIAFWLSPALLATFVNSKPLSSFGDPKVGLQTGDTNRFLRYWVETDINRIAMPQSGDRDGFKWFPICKGGEYRRWYGNNDYVVNWENDGFEIRNFKNDKGKLKSRPQNVDYYFRKGITWNLISSSNFAVRCYPEGMIFDVSANSFFCENRLYKYIAAVLNSKILFTLSQILNPTINFSAGVIANLPIAIDETRIPEIDDIVTECVRIEKEDWDSFEWSWDFKRHPLVSRGKIQDNYESWKQKCEERFALMKNYEERLNDIFIDLYGLQGEISPIVSDEDVTVKKANLQREIKSLISYAVGCMFGRYSLEREGLVYAGGQWRNIIEEFSPDADNIIPICTEEYFEDDIVARFIEFVKIAFGKEYLEENLQFISSALGGDGSPRDIIRNYFVNEFYNDHVKNYQKRPIYWLFDSGKKNGFKCLIYMHRYQADTIARIRTDYVHEQQSRYRTALADIEQRINAASTSERVKLNKQLKTIQDQAEELRKYEEKIHHLADQMISIDLDDGVKENYAKFQDVLAKIK